MRQALVAVVFHALLGAAGQEHFLGLEPLPFSDGHGAFTGDLDPFELGGAVKLVADGDAVRAGVGLDLAVAMVGVGVAKREVALARAVGDRFVRQLVGVVVTA